MLFKRKRFVSSVSLSHVSDCMPKYVCVGCGLGCVCVPMYEHLFTRCDENYLNIHVNGFKRELSIMEMCS